MTTAHLHLANPNAIAEAARVLLGGGLVAFPTETVYGLGADATNGEAVARLFAAKGRPRINPLIVHLPDRAAAEQVVRFNAMAARLADAFWPGPLTVVLPRSTTTKVSLLVSAGLDTVAIRVPAHSVARQLLKTCRVPVAAPSANRSGQLSSTRAAHVAEELGSRIDFIVDGGAAALGIESTVIGFDNDTPILLRAGAIARKDIEEVTGPLGRPRVEAAPKSPGQLASHYAPRASLRLAARDVRASEALLAFGPDVPAGAVKTLNLSASGNLHEAAANLFAMLRMLDASGTPTIAVMRVPDIGLGEAINDRLRRAAAPREVTA